MFEPAAVEFSAGQRTAQCLPFLITESDLRSLMSDADPLRGVFTTDQHLRRYQVRRMCAVLIMAQLVEQLIELIVLVASVPPRFVPLFL